MQTILDSMKCEDYFSVLVNLSIASAVQQIQIENYNSTLKCRVDDAWLKVK